MLISNTCRFCTDIFGTLVEEPVQEPEPITEEETGSSPPAVETPFTKKAMLISKTAFDCTSVIGVTKFNITMVRPTGTKIRFMFKDADGKIYKVSTTGGVVEYGQNLTVDNVLADGNTPENLTALNDVSGFVGKKIYPIIALYAKSTAEDMPAVKIGITVLNPVSTLSKTVESAAYDLADEGDTLPRIVSITPDIYCTGNGSVTITARLRDDFGKWTSYMALADTVDKEANGIQFKIIYKVGVLGGADSARLNSITVENTYGKMVVADDNADIYTVVQNYDIPLQMCHATVRHSPLNDSKIEAYVNFMKPTKSREMIKIGTANGSFQELVLGLSTNAPDKNIDAATIKLYQNEKPLTSFSYNSETSTVAFTAKSGTYIYASYDYDHDVELWRKMTLDVTEPYNNETGDCMSRFTYALSDEEAVDKTISNVRVTIKRTTGTVTNQDLGRGVKNKKRLIVLPHIPTVSSIKFSSENVTWTCEAGSNILTVVADVTTDLIVSYKWRGEPVQIYSLAAGWSVA